MIERVRRLCFADALSLAGLGMCAAGMMVTGEALVAAAQRTPSASAINWHDRLLLGLWAFRLEHALLFTLGLIVLWVGLGLGGRLGSHTETAVRLVGGVAIGYVLLAVAVLAGSTIVAAAGSVGGGGLEVSFGGRERLATWLLQLTTVAAMSMVWVLAGGRLGERFALAGVEQEGATEHGGDEIDEFDRFERIDEPPPAVTPAAERVVPDDPAVDAGDHTAPPPAPAAASPATPSLRARRLYEERLGFSPMRDEARALLEQVTTAERAGRLEEAESLADRLAAM